MGTGTVRRIRQRAEAPTLSEAIAAYLATLDHPETAGTRRVYASTLHQLRTYLGPELPVATLDEPDTAARLAGWFAARWVPEHRRRSSPPRSRATMWRSSSASCATACRTWRPAIGTGQRRMVIASASRASPVPSCARAPACRDQDGADLDHGWIAG